MTLLDRRIATCRDEIEALQRTIDARRETLTDLVVQRWFQEHDEMGAPVAYVEQAGCLVAVSTGRKIPA